MGDILSASKPRHCENAKHSWKSQANKTIKIATPSLKARNDGWGGFTLIELSIVLVIIGLIIGGVVVGQSLVRQSQLNSLITDSQRYIQATNTFQQKYGALPGDFANATGYWTVNTGNCAPPDFSTSNASKTCNGNGDGQINTSSNVVENFLFWQHLAMASLIEGSYIGTASVTGAGNLTHNVGTNIPKSKVDGAGFAVQYAGIKSSDANYFDNSYGHVFIIGGNDTANKYPVTPIMTAIEAYNVDAKFDDGVITTGNILSWKKNASGYNTSCSTTNSSSTAAYNTTVSGYLCSLIFITGF